MMGHSANPLAAAIHPDPYPYYAVLARERPLHRDDALGLWVASSAEAGGADLRREGCAATP